MLMPRIGVREPAISRATRNMVPSPPKTSSKSTWRVSVGASGQTIAFKLASWAVALSLYSFRPATEMRRAARLTALAQETFPELPITPTRLILSAQLFNQYQEFFVDGRPQQRGFREAPPFEARLSGDEIS